MPPEAEKERVASLPVEPGVYALRYLSSSCEIPPRVFVEVSPVSRADVQVVFVPGKPVGMLEKPKQLALVVAERRGHLQLTVSAIAGGGSSARVELQPLDAVEAPQQPQRPEVQAPIAPGPLLVCHVARRGDVAASSGEWIGGPEAPAVIEGVQIDWDAALAGGLEYQVMIQGAGGQWSQWFRARGYAGTRGRGLGLVGVRIRLTAAAPAGARLTGEAAFLGCPLIKEQGRELEFVSLSGVDPLVGLRLRPELDAGASAEIVVGETERAEPEPFSPGAALKVFKSKRAGDRVVGLGG